MTKPRRARLARTVTDGRTRARRSQAQQGA
jgi:hypothetical protein